ncbi:MAG: hypothetical protein QM802_20575 [Agriterribacter sp.]
MKKGWISAGPKRIVRHSPKDNINYKIDNSVIDFTSKILQQYGKLPQEAEGVVYWAGKVRREEFIVSAAFAPTVTASRYGFLTDHYSNGLFTEFICDNNLVYLAQVHSHPGICVDHSGIDDRETAFRSEGLLSLVVPTYGDNGMLPFKHCGIHRYHNSNFDRLSDRYISRHFTNINLPTTQIILKDARQ